MKKAISFLVAALMLCASIPCASAAAGEPIQPMWKYLNRIDGTIKISTGGIATVAATVQSRASGSQKTGITVSLQQKKPDGWKEIKSWTATQEGSYALITRRSWAVPHGYSYKIVVTGRMYKGLQVLEQESKAFNYGYFA